MKKSNKKKYIIIAVVVLLIIGIAAGGSDEVSTNKDKPSSTETNQTTTPAPTNNATATPEPTAEPTTAITPEPTPATVTYKASTYKIGTDMPAGEYVIFNDGFAAYMEIAKDASGSFESIIANDNISTHTIVTVKDGQYLKITGGYAMAIEDVPTLDTTTEGMFKVGVHLKEGEYKVEVDENSAIGYGYIEVSKNNNHIFESIVSNDNFEGTKYISVKKGQYLKLNGAHIVK